MFYLHMEARGWYLLIPNYHREGAYLKIRIFHEIDTAARMYPNVLKDWI